MSQFGPAQLTAFLRACLIGNIEEMDFLAEAGCNIDAKTSTGRSALQLAQDIAQNPRESDDVAKKIREGWTSTGLTSAGLTSAAAVSAAVVKRLKELQARRTEAEQTATALGQRPSAASDAHRGR